MEHIFIAMVVIFVVGFIYLIPAVIASQRNHHQTGAILILNLFMGWTALGWLAALMWAMSAVRYDMNKKPA